MPNEFGMTTTKDSSKKGFLQRPENIAGVLLPLLILGPLAVYIFINLAVILAWLVGIVTNMLYLGGLCAVLAVLVIIVSDKKNWVLAKIAYRSISRFVAGRFVEMDPIGVMKSYVQDLHDRRDEMRKSIDTLEGQKKTLKGVIDSNEQQRIHSLRMAGQAQKDEALRKVVILQSRKAGRFQKSNMSLQDLFNRMEILSKSIRKMYETAEFLIADIESEVEVRSQERKALLAGYSAFRAARRIVEGGGDERELYDLALEKLADDYGMKMGEIETFMDMSQGFIQSVDLENGVYEADALSQLEQWDKKSEQLLLGKSDAPPALQVANTPGVRVGNPDNAFADLLERTDEANKRQGL